MPRRRKQKLIFGKDYYYENGRCILTRDFLLTMGECCNNACPNCPYKSDHAAGNGVPGASQRGSRSTSRIAR